MTRNCEQYLENPELSRGHLAECESCRRLEAWLDVGPEGAARHDSILKRLPVASWEGAAHRSWPLAIITTLLVLIAAAAFFLIAGVSPAQGFAASLRELAPRVDMVSVATSFAELLKRAPASFHLIVFSAFIAVNLLFALLLRRPTKGYDVTAR
jgi:hypothetical protein